MTAVEMSNVFDTKLNSYVNQHMFGNQQGDMDFTCDEYEKSLFLTAAQEEVVRMLYSGKNSQLYPSLNVFMEAFDDSEENKRILAPLINSTTIHSSSFLPDNINSTNNNRKIIAGASKLHNYWVMLPSNLWFITFEGVTFEENQGCPSDLLVETIPVTQDQLHKMLRNPFRRPNKRKVFRLDIDKNKVEIISSYEVSDYYCRYLRKPSPIVTTLLPQEVSIDGVTTIRNCELGVSIHNTIVDIAVQIAYRTKLIGRQSTTQSNN